MFATSTSLKEITSTAIETNTYVDVDVEKNSLLTWPDLSRMKHFGAPEDLTSVLATSSDFSSKLLNKLDSTSSL